MEQLEFLERIKKLVIISMFSDDDLMQRLVLKGGNLLDIVFGVSTRASVDLDFSIDGAFETLQILRQKIERVLETTFDEEGFVVFDINLREVPPGLTEDMKDFWGGYKVDFKIIEKDQHKAFKDDVQNLRKRARILGQGSPKFKIDISKHEYCDAKETKMLEEFTIYTYTPEMVVAEKLRAICQQMPDYVKLVKSHPSARARDFVDIHTVAEHFGIDFRMDAFRNILLKTFEVKRVSLGLIAEIIDFKEFHRADFTAVQATVKPDVELRDFDFYYDYVVEKCNDLESFWDV